MRVLVIEDDAKLADYIARSLKENGHVVDQAADGADGLSLASSMTYDVLIVDRMIPTIDGLEVVQSLRESGSDVPVLMLTALGEVNRRVEGLKAGADDYLPKPFAIAELLARLEALVRRKPTQMELSRLVVGNLEMDLVTQVVVRGNNRIALQPTEYRVLEFLMRRAGQVVTRTMLLEGVWSFNFEAKSNYIEAHISNLRRKIDTEGEVPLFHTVRGAGYVLKASD